MTRIGVYPEVKFQKYLGMFNAFSRMFHIDFELTTLDKMDTFDYLVLVNVEFPEKAANCKRVFHIDINSGNMDMDMGTIFFSDSPLLDKYIRNQELDEIPYNDIVGLLDMLPDDEVLARKGKMPVWIRRKIKNCDVDVVGFPLLEMQFDKTFIEHVLQNGAFSVVPIINFFKEATAWEWQHPEPTVSFMINKANIRFKRYGYVDYAKLLADAKTYNYHVSIATLPYDLWYTRNKTLKLFNENPKYLSMSIAGNNYTKNELKISVGENYEERTLAQAFRRVDRFNKRYKHKISRVMSVPYDKISIKMLKTMASFDLEAVNLYSPFIWDNYSKPREQDYFHFDFVAGGLTSTYIEGMSVIQRRKSKMSPSEILLFLMLNRPVIIFYDRNDLCTMYETMARTAQFINRFKNVKWGSLTDITRSLYSYRITKDVMDVIIYSNKVKIPIPEGIKSLCVHTPVIYGDSTKHYLHVDGSCYLMTTEKHEVKWKGEKLDGYTYTLPVENQKEITIDLHNDDKVTNYKKIPGPFLGIWPILRRAYTENRERCDPFMDKYFSKIE